MIEGQLRDQLAVERTRLANERTMLAYIRTALALAAAGGAMLQFLPEHASLMSIAWVFIVAGCATMVIGTYRFFAVRRELKAARSEQ
jgi:putative membrane protein